ncbi:hypothetical protein D7W79_17230 [Corallococcus exercitus]|uniref:hypothetical protein n=1 Tax=Corallococcus exercitus TaxID=2316736 RepID=UPI000EA1518C|nr:hypothetical protein [Corallococcus exercitus]RKG76692.1 hypothetical protein D7W79_17230 [Corallococcus exercitus]
MRRLLAVLPLLTLVGCSYVGITSPPGSRLAGNSSSRPPVIRVGKSESEPLKSPETKEPASSKEASTAEASDAPGATQ